MSALPAMTPALSLADVEAYDPRTRRTAQRLRARCPLHGGDHQQSFSADLETGAYCCHACGAKGKLADYWTDRPRERPRRDERLVLHRKPPEAAPPAVAVLPDTPTARLVPAAVSGLEQLPAWQAALPNSPGETYLTKRGIPLPLARQHGLGWAAPGAWPNGDLAYGYLVFPLSVGAYGRAVHPEYPRRDAPKAVRHRKTSGQVGLFNADLLADPPAWLHLCEAPLDALTLAVYGLPAVALVGTALGEQARVFRRCRGVLLALDGDVAGEKATLAAAGALRALGIVVLRLPVTALGRADDLNAAHMAGMLRLPQIPPG
ncbi:MAG: toprim domain-containing protein [Chloroflexota bacterium]